MERNFIKNEKISKHNVEPYHFKVLATSPLHSEDLEDEFFTEEKEDEFKPRQKIKEIPEQIRENPTPNNSEEPPKVQESENSFVEKLLKKTDELSSNIIKLQMQIENQEAEFEKRLADETQRSKEDGLKEGFEQAKAQAQEEIKSLQTQYSRSIGVLEEECQKFKEFTSKTENELSTTAIDVAKEVIQKEIAKDSSSIASSLAKALLKEVQDSTKTTIKVNPIDFEFLKEEYAEEKQIAISADEAIAQGGVIILSDAGNLDGTISTRLNKIIQMMDE